jgi:hypothetical protein
MFLRKFYMPEDPRDGNGPIIMINGVGNTIVTGSGLGTSGPGGIGTGGNGGTGPGGTSNPTPVFPLPSGTLTDCIEFATPQLMQASLVSFLTNRVLYYKINLNQTQKNIYGEALEKWYYEGIQTRCYIERSPETIDNEMFGSDINQQIKITIPEAALSLNNPFNIVVPIDISPEIGDIVFDLGRERYYEIHNITTTYYPVATNVGITNIDCPPVNIMQFELDCYMTRVSRLNLSPYKLL